MEKLQSGKQVLDTDPPFIFETRQNQEVIMLGDPITSDFEDVVPV